MHYDVNVSRISTATMTLRVEADSKEEAGGGLEKAVTFSTLIASSVARP